MNRKIAVLILGCNHKEYLEDALSAALKQDYTEYDVTYIDNASSDGSADFVREHFPSIQVITNEKNTGYAGGYDAMLRKAFSQDYTAAILLNPDTIVSEDWLSELVASAYVDDTIALAQSKVLIWKDGPTKTINTFGNIINFLGFGYCGNYRQEDNEDFSRDRDISYPSGSSLLIKKEFYPERISFDTDYFAYLEDQDLGWQAHIMGYRTIASARSIVWHKYDFQKKKLNNFKFYLLERNRFFFLMKFFEIRTLLLIFPALVIMDIGIMLHSIVNGYFLQKLKSELDFFLHLPRTLKKRRVLQKKRVINDKELFHLLNPEIVFDEVDSAPLRLANAFLKKYYSFVRKVL